MYSNSLPFSQESDISFLCSSTEVKVYVGTTLLGSINQSYPVTVYISVSGSTKTIHLDEISNNDYLYNNTSNKTVTFNQENSSSNLHIAKCSTSNKFDLIGVDDEVMGIRCTSGSAELYFDISSVNRFKAKIEQTSYNNQTVNRMFVRYAHHVIDECGTDPLCSQGIFCYSCLR